MAKKKHFPKDIFVVFEKGMNDPDYYLSASESYEGMEAANGERDVAIYSLVAVKILKNQSELV